MGLLVAVALGLTAWGGQSVVLAQETAPAGEESGWTGEQSAQESDGAGVQKTVRKYADQIKDCYEVQLKQDPTLAGRVEMQFTIHDGRSEDVRVLNNTTGSEELGKCIAGEIRSWQWPDELEGEVVYPFILTTWAASHVHLGTPAAEQPSLVEPVVRKYVGQLAFCYELQLKQDPTLAGRVEMQFTIHDGRSKDVRVLNNTTGSEELGECFAGKIRRFRWPKELEGEVVYPFVLTPPGGSSAQLGTQALPGAEQEPAQ